MFILSSISSGWEFWSVNHTSIHEKSRLLVFKNTNVLGEISINWTNGVMEQMEQIIQDSWILLIIIAILLTILLAILQWTNTTSVVSKWDRFLPFSSLVTLLLVL